jgi:acyl transferase domain-containing protein/acyl-CoA synthetase (AMP-forming)/AMP-acid ligase II/acyl carrier protein
VLRERARTQPDEPAFTYVDYELDPAGVAQTLTWARLYRQTSNVARELKACGSTGDRAVILAPQGTEYLLAFLGALQAGQIAVPLPLPMPGSGDERVSSVLLDASPATILTTSAVTGDIAQYIRPKPGADAITVVEVDLLDLDSVTGATADADDLPSTAHLQYTSGSTRTPAGVMVSHKNIQVNCAQLRSAYYQDGIAPPDTTVVSWLPFFHDMGLILNIAFPIFGGFRSVLTSPPAFLQRPARWMQLLASNPHAFSAGPNIAFELAAAKTSDEDLADLDLGGVRNILNGAERVNPSTLRRFAERFARFNLRPEALRPSYGLAEGTLYVATRGTGQPPETVFFESEKLTAGDAKRSASGEGTALVSYGMPTSPTVRIVDPEARVECPEGTVGEIWVHGDNVCEGYWQKPEETERTFGAELVDPSGGAPESPWLRTGDLGFISDGEMFIVGRIKDLLIVYGRNYAPDDIEATIQEITAGRVVAGAVPGEDGVEKLVTIVEFKAGGDAEEAAQRVSDVKRKITAAVSRTHELGIADLVMVPPHSIPLTTSGKVRRRDSLKLYLGGEFSRLDELIRPQAGPAADDTEVTPEADSGWSQRLRTLRAQQQDILVGLVRAEVATVLGNISPGEIDPEIPFRDMGFDSVKATELIDRLKNVTALALPPTLAFDHPTPNALATHLGHRLSGSVPAAAHAAPRVESAEPIAVVGMACRFPGGIDSPASLWDVVTSGREALCEFPPDRGWNLAELFDPDPDAVGKTYTRVGGFLAEAAGFDAGFFAISDREALTMDPQQRLLLEVSWEALETARIDPTGLAGSNTGVFVGAWSQNYGAGGSEGTEGYGLTGGSPSVASGRISYTLGLQGPAITVDTACSSSLVATHLACQSLHNGESSLALAGGVTVMTTPSVFTEFARQRGLAADGRCKAFSADADGTGWGEGAAIVVLERLSDARRNNHPVLAVIAGSAVNSDGASNGLTAPNGPAQQRVITEAAANAGVGLDQVDVVEAHGTGTTLGDPIEAGALLATYGAARGDSHPLWLGSIKSNIGHTQAAAGVAGIIKMIEALNHDSLPPTLHADRPSPSIDWSTRTVCLLTEAVPWPATDHPRTAAVSSFGISGTNAHLILQQPPEAEPGEHTATDDDLQVRMWPVSARTPSALCAQADRLHQFLAGSPDVDLTDVAYSLGATRAHHPYRAVITAPADSGPARDGLLGALDALRSDESHPHLVRHHFLARRQGKTVFVLPGQGAQYAGMGRELYEHHRVFAETVDACDEALRPLAGWSVREVLRQDPSAPALDRVDVVQPVLFTMMVSLAEVLAGYGIMPDAVIGHSQGEIAAAYIAGALSLPEAVTVVARRSQALSELRGTGGMASVLLAAERVEPLLQRWGDGLSIAAVNGPSHTIISGDPAALEQFGAACDREGIHFRLVAVDYASHSAQVEPARARLLAELADLKPAASNIPLYSTVGGALDAEPLDTTAMTAEYWYRNLREPVRFHDRVVQLLAAGQTTFVELSPHPVLAPAITDTVSQSTESAQSAVIITLHRDRPDRDSLATALAQLHTHGQSPAWPALYARADSVELPTYAFQRRDYWTTPTPAAAVVSSPAEGALWKAIDDDAVDTVADLLGLSDGHGAAPLGTVVGALRQWRNNLSLQSAANELRYQVNWRTVTPNSFPSTRRRWLVLAFPDQADDAWITGLSQRYPDSVELLTFDPDEFDRSSLSALLTTAATRAQCDGIISFMATHDRAHPDFPGLSTGLLATLLVTQAHCDSALGLPLWVVTHNGVSVAGDDDAARPSQAAVWGLGQSACLEHPDLWGGLIDLPPSATPHDIEQLYAILRCPQDEDQLAIRRHGVSARRLIEASLSSERVERPHSWNPSGPALITGATGRLGKHLVGWLADAGANPIVMMSRSAATDPQLAELAIELQNRGVTTTSVSVDLTDRSALAAVLTDLRRAHGPIHTVVHAAADIGWTTVTDLTAEVFYNAYAAKAVGAEHLVELLDDQPPETFILLSSAAATWGSAHQGAYAAANAHIEALAARLRANGRTALAPAFGLWADETGNIPPEVLTSFEHVGINKIPPTTALAALQQALEATDTLTTIADVSWERFLPAVTARRSHPLFTEVAPRPVTTETTSSTAIVSASALRETLADQTPEHQRLTLTAMVAGATAAALAHPDPDALHNDVAFKDLGIDSLTAVELRNSLTARTGLSLPTTLVFDHPTTTALVTHLADLLTDTGAPMAAAVTTSTSGDGASDNRLALADQASYLAERAVHSALIQFTWVYNRGVDVDGLRRFHRNLGLGLLGRRIERSPIPFARHRWVVSPASEDIDFAATPRPRAEISKWADERAHLPIDAELGPGWHLGVLPLEDGGAAVTLVVSHNIADGMAVGRAIADAVEGRIPDLGYPPAGTRTRSRAFREDLRLTVKELPDIPQAVLAVIRRARQDGDATSSNKAAVPARRTAGGDHAVDVPVLTAFVDLEDWDARAKALGGNSNSLAAGFACRLAARVGHVNDDGTVTLRLPVTIRTEADNSGNALTAVDVRADPNHSVTKLGELHAQITQATLEAMENSDEFLAPLPLVPITPKWVIRKLAGALAGGAGLVTCSNVGDLPPAVNRPDGSDADQLYMTPVEPDIKKSTLEVLGGRLLVGSARLHGKVGITISAYLLGGPNTKAELREIISQIFAELDLIAEVD